MSIIMSNLDKILNIYLLFLEIVSHYVIICVTNSYLYKSTNLLIEILCRFKQNVKNHYKNAKKDVQNSI